MALDGRTAGILRGVSYYPADGRWVKLYIAEGEPLFRKFSDRLEWDYKTLESLHNRVRVHRFGA